MENGHKWSYKVPENAYGKVLESHGNHFHHSISTLTITNFLLI